MRTLRYSTKEKEKIATGHIQKTTWVLTDGIIVSAMKLSPSPT